MAYTKQTWVNNETLVDEDRMNHIENGIYQNAEDISEINQSLSDFSSPQSATVNVSFNSNSGYLYLTKIGGIVICTIELTSGGWSTSATNELEIESFPSDFLPARRVFCPFVGVSSGNAVSYGRIFYYADGRAVIVVSASNTQEVRATTVWQAS